MIILAALLWVISDDAILLTGGIIQTLVGIRASADLVEHLRHPGRISVALLQAIKQHDRQNYRAHTLRRKAEALYILSKENDYGYCFSFLYTSRGCGC